MFSDSLNEDKLEYIRITERILPFATVIGTIALIFRLISDYLKENVFEYGGIYKKDETRKIYHLKGFSVEEKESHKETGYYLRISKKSGNGRLEDCEGVITFDEPDGTRFDVHTVWDSDSYCRYRNISLKDDLKLFHISEDGKKIFLFSQPDEKEGKQPYKTLTDNINDNTLNTTLTIKLGVKSGNPPKKSFTTTIKEVIDKSLYEVG